MNDPTVSRRDLLKSAALAGTAITLNSTLAKAEELLLEPPAAAGASMIGVKFEKRDKVRLGIIGVGGRGLGMLGEWMAVDGVEVTAICDIDQKQIDKTLKRIEKTGQKAPAVYGKNERDYENLCKRDDVDFIYIATPWDWHVPMGVAAMNNGKH